MDTQSQETKAKEKAKEEAKEETETKAKEPLRAPLPNIFFGEDVQSAWVEWEEYKKEKKQKLTPSTAKKQMQFLGGRSGPEAIAIINRSITNGWTGLFELNNTGNNGGKGNNKKGDADRATAEAVLETYRDVFTGRPNGQGSGNPS